jgi:phosphomannomutase
MSGELNYHVPNVQQAINAVREKFANTGSEDFTDGYSLESDVWRFNIRGSNTEPLLRLNIEAREQKRVDDLKSEIEAIIKVPQPAATA